MADRFMSNLDASQRVSGALSFLGSSKRIGDARPMREYQVIGETRDRDLHFVVANGVPDSTTTTSESAISKARTPREPSVWYDALGTGDVYEVVKNRIWISDEPVWDDGSTFNAAMVYEWQGALVFDPNDTGLEIDIDRQYKSLPVKNTEDVLKAARQAGAPLDSEGWDPLELVCDPSGKFIVTLREFRDQDYAQSNQLLASRRVPINELAWQAFALAVGASTQNLQVIFTLDVRNNGFQVVLENAHAETMRPINKVTVWTRADQPYFSQLLGSESVSGKVLQLTNHHNAVGNKRIAKIITAASFVEDPEDMDWDDVDKGPLSVALVLEPIPEADLAPLRMTF